MLEKLLDIIQKYEELGERIGDPDTIANMELWRSLMKEHAELQPLAESAKEYEAVCQQIDEAHEMEKDPEMREMARDELNELDPRKEALEQRVRILMLPHDPNDEKNVILEIRGGAGGEEAALFGSVLLRMYQHYAESRGWTFETLSENETEMGGVKEGEYRISGKNVFSRMRYESGVHRVQRVPETEAQGRIHTSTTTVAVLPEAEEVDVQISPNDLRIDTYRSGGAGGQHVNRTDSAVRITHLPSGIVVECQNERSQVQNREQAMRVLRSRLLDAAIQAQHDSVAGDRRSQVGTGDRSERIRTYNYPQSRVTDHRIGLTLYKLDSFINGDMDEMLDALTVADQTEKLKNAGL